jgi:hypothetical protein
MDQQEADRRKKMVIGGLAGAAIVATLIGLREPTDQAETVGAYDLSWSETRAVKSAVKDSLRDPKGATFERLRASRAEDGEISVCGYVNARNAFGGMTGDNLFYVPIHASGRAGVAWASDARLAARQCWQAELISTDMYKILTR